MVRHPSSGRTNTAALLEIVVPNTCSENAVDVPTIDHDVFSGFGLLDRAEPISTTRSLVLTLDGDDVLTDTAGGLPLFNEIVT